MRLVQVGLGGAGGAAGVMSASGVGGGTDPG